MGRKKSKKKSETKFALAAFLFNKKFIMALNSGFITYKKARYILNNEANV